MGQSCWYSARPTVKVVNKQAEDQKAFSMLIAIHHRDLTRVQNLLTLGFNAQKVITPDKRNAIDLAIEAGYIPTLELIKKTQVDFCKEKESGDGNYLHFCAKTGTPEVFKWLVDQGISEQGLMGDGSNIAHVAWHYGNQDIVLHIAQTNNSLFHSFDENGYNTLHRAAVRGHNHIIMQLIQILKLDPNEPTQKGKKLAEIVPKDVWEDIQITIGPYLTSECAEQSAPRTKNIN